MFEVHAPYACKVHDEIRGQILGEYNVVFFPENAYACVSGVR